MTHLEEEPNNEYLQTTHGDYHGDLDQTKVDNSGLGASDGAEVSVLSRAKVFLVSGYGRQQPRDLIDGFLECAGLFWR
jgi:hypothetical protein